MGFDVVVVGSINYDISVFSPRLPQPGETLIGSGHGFGPGGKGANQAVAAARLGARVALVGRVGDDEWGVSLLEGLVSEGIDVSAVTTDDDSATGIALITIDGSAENTIVVSPGANMKLTPGHVSDHADLISEAGVVLSQLEVPLETVQAVAESTSGTFVLNPAPAQSLPGGILDKIDVLVPNRSELAVLSGSAELDDPTDVATQARHFLPAGVTVVTLGGEGVVLVDRDGSEKLPPFEVRAVDTTGAGDTFCGALAVSLGGGMNLRDAARFASAAGALAVTRRGAQDGMPSRSDVEALLDL